jgi:hypothetical protein
MRVEGGRLVEAVEGTNVLGAASFAGTTLDQARGIARDAERRIARGGERGTSRYFLALIGGRDLPDPARLWIDYDADLETASTARRGASPPGSTAAPSPGAPLPAGRVTAPDAAAPAPSPQSDRPQRGSTKTACPTTSSCPGRRQVRTSRWSLRWTVAKSH